MSTVIRNGTIVTADLTYSADVLIEDGVIIEIGKTQVSSMEEFRAAANATKSGEIVRLKIVRSGSVIYIAFER